MVNHVAAHYGGDSGLADAIADCLREAGTELQGLKTTDLATVDEFHIRGRKATLELAGQMNLHENARVLDVGSGLGGPARTLAEAHGCKVIGVDLTPAFSHTATTLSGWVGLADKVAFQQGDATALPFENDQFDAAMTIHVAMNIAAKDRVYAEAKRVIKPGGVFAIYDVLQGEGGEVLFPVPWARDPSISHLATPNVMKTLLGGAGFDILDIRDSTEESQAWFEAMMTRMEKSGARPVTFQTFLGGDFPEMSRNQVRNLTERRIRTVSYICEA